MTRLEILLENLPVGTQIFRTTSGWTVQMMNTATNFERITVRDATLEGVINRFNVTLKEVRMVGLGRGRGRKRAK